MTLHRRTLMGAAGLAALSPLAAGAQTRWQMATPYPDGNFQTRNVRAFVQEIEQASGGRLAIQVHSGGALLRMPEIKRGVQTGQVQMGEILLTAYANEDPLFDADALPQLVTNFRQAKRLADLQRPFIEARFQRQGLSLLYMVPWPPAGLYAQQPVTSLEQLRGARFRTFSPMTNRFAQLIGAQPTLVQQAELAQAFATGVVQAQITSAATGVDTQAWDFSKYYYDVKAFIPKNVTMVNARAFAKLSPDAQKAVLAAAERAEKRGWELARSKTDELVATLKKNGMEVGPAPAAVEAELSKIGVIMADEWLKKAGPDGKAILDAAK